MLSLAQSDLRVCALTATKAAHKTNNASPVRVQLASYATSLLPLDNIAGAPSRVKPKLTACMLALRFKDFAESIVIAKLLQSNQSKA